MKTRRETITMTVEYLEEWLKTLKIESGNLCPQDLKLKGLEIDQRRNLVSFFVFGGRETPEGQEAYTLWIDKKEGNQ